jgi:ABC-type uncharacterized transport system permease subunit
MMNLVLGSSAIFLYLCGWIILIGRVRNQSVFSLASLQVISVLAIGLHGFAVYELILSAAGIDFSLTSVLTLLALVINTLVWFSTLNKPLHSLYLGLFPVSIITLIVALNSSTYSPTAPLSIGIQIHILLSILAYSFLAIAALQALMCGYQNGLLKHKHQSALMRSLPALETMETLLFQVIWVGEIILTLALISGFLVFENLFAQQLIHKVVFSLLAWLIYGGLLVGRIIYGWRGSRAINWCWVGFCAMLLGYIGSKFVIEYILN